ncbi:InlB B-repeat-containing protein [Paraeggerthella sp.]|uniref:InlB B-repeat-containing protein n=1 Tax=Paraeggerthella sp. TaxID=2897350 RepID=UPI003527DFD6
MTGQGILSRFGTRKPDGSGRSYSVSEVLSLTGNTTLYAQWKESKPVTYTYTALTGGSVSSASETIAPVTGIASGSTASPDSGYRFDGWYDNAEASGNPISRDARFVPSKVDGVYAGGSYWARFVVDETQTYAVSYATDGNGTADPADNRGIQVLGTSGVTGSTAAPAPGYKFEGWYKGDARIEGAGAALSAELAAANVDRDGGLYKATTFTAKFVPDDGQTYAVSYATDGNGTADPADNRGIQVLGTSGVTGSTAAPAPGYKFEGWYKGDARIEGGRGGAERRAGRRQRRPRRRPVQGDHLHGQVRPRRRPDLRGELRHRRQRHGRPRRQPGHPGARHPPA